MNSCPSRCTQFHIPLFCFCSLLKASYELRNLSRKKGPSEEDFASLANSVDQFSFSLLDPLKSNDEARHVLGDSIDDILDSAINWEQKRVNVNGLFITVLFSVT